MKKILILLLTILPLTLRAEESENQTSGSCGEHCSFVMEGDTLKLKGYGDIDYQPLYGSPWYWNQHNITKIVIENESDSQTFKSIGALAFCAMGFVKEVVLPEGLEKMGAYAFCHCPELTMLVIPKSLTGMNIDCMGYFYDEENDEYLVQENFTLYVYRDSPAFRYAVTNQINYEFIRTGTVYYILIAVVSVMIVILIIAIIKILKNRNGSKGDTLLDFYPMFNYFTDKREGAGHSANSGSYTKAKSNYNR